MRQHVTNNDLTNIMNDIDRMMQSPALAIFLGPKVKRFREQNRLRINSLDTKFKKLIEENVVFKDGNPELEIVEGKQKLKFIDEEHEKTYNEERQKLLAIEFDIEI